MSSSVSRGPLNMPAIAANSRAGESSFEIHHTKVYNLLAEVTQLSERDFGAQGDDTRLLKDRLISATDAIYNDSLSLGDKEITMLIDPINLIGWKLKKIEQFRRRTFFEVLKSDDSLYEYFLSTIRTIGKVAQGILFGKAEKASLMGVDIEFGKWDRSKEHNWISKSFFYAPFRMHTFIHEMGHALAARSLIKNTIPLCIINQDLGGRCRLDEITERDSVVKESIITAAGPIFHTLVSSVLMSYGKRSNNDITGLPIAVFGMLGVFLELMYAVISTIEKDDKACNGDFSLLARSGWKDYSIALSLLLVAAFLPPLLI